MNNLKYKVTHIFDNAGNIIGQVYLLLEKEATVKELLSKDQNEKRTSVNGEFV